MVRSRTRPVTIRFEQAVYGSFPFWDKGYAVLAHSPDCRSEWLTGLRAACQRFGERPAGVAEAEVRGLFALRLPGAGGPWMIVGVSSPGSDDRGRPGALAFHALFLSPRDYRRTGCHPFALAGAFRTDWTNRDATRPLAAGTWAIARPRLLEPEPEPGVPPDPTAARLAAALAQGRRVALEAAAPIDALAPQVWRLLPARVRRRATVATWAFGNANRFDLVALPRRTLALADIASDPSYLDPAALANPDELPTTTRPRAAHRLPWLIAGAVLLVAGLILIAGLAWR
jgi:hypothetical protein